MDKEKQFKEIATVILHASRLMSMGDKKEVISYMEFVKHNAEKAAKELGYTEKEIKDTVLKMYGEKLK